MSDIKKTLGLWVIALRIMGSLIHKYTLGTPWTPERYERLNQSIRQWEARYGERNTDAAVIKLLTYRKP